MPVIHAPVIHPIVRRLAAFAALVGLLAGCAGPGASSGPTKLVVGLGYVPNVQFAQFYRAQEAGYYREAGLEVTFDNKTDEDLVPLTAQG
jgi:NitT/TauT family transport system substrate-binding protein